jgi:hypothetical protein
MTENTSTDQAPDALPSADAETAAQVQAQAAEADVAESAPPDAAAESADADDAAEKKRTPWFMRKIGEAEQARAEAEARAAQAAAEIARLRAGEKLPEGMVRADEVEQRAAAIVAARDMNAKADAAAIYGGKTFADFDDAVAAMGVVLAPNPAKTSEFFAALTALPTEEAARVYYDLGKDPEAAERLLRMPPAAMGVEIARRAARPAPAPAPKPVSKAPPPIQPLAPTGRSGNDEPPTDNVADWGDWFIKGLRQRRGVA